MNIILASIISLGLLGLALGVSLAYASKKFHVERDPRIEKINEALVGTNCGACGFPGCAGAAEAIAKGDALVNVCLPGGEEVARKVAEIMGFEYSSEGKLRDYAVVLCQGNNTKAKKKYMYYGLNTCLAASKLEGGDKACTYGCLGYADCQRVCNYGAIKIQDGLAIIDQDKCTSCTLCVAACPKNIIKMIPAKEKRVVFCQSKDKGPVSRKVCTISCIGCGICVKNCPFEAIALKDNLATINYDKCTNCAICEEKCPTKAIMSG
ncbi:MAG: RnfABCDGE type electron transport complex subunit B [Candidatus Margulisbacteria bacterium]|nr:RnfABCDGE type electron transport complex subunit B [Candidatus Margulisiibacteriota bacterium]